MIRMQVYWTNGSITDGISGADSGTSVEQVNTELIELLAKDTIWLVFSSIFEKNMNSRPGPIYVSAATDRIRSIQVWDTSVNRTPKETP